jgi:hypothetical protein
MNGAISKLIALIMLIIIVGLIIYAAFFTESEPQNYEVSYDSKEGIITIRFDEAIPDADWAARVSYEDGDIPTHTEYVTQNAKVALSAGERIVTITDDPGVLVNLENRTYDIEIYSVSGAQKSITCHFTFNGHELSSSEMVVIAIVIIVFILCFIIAFIRRLNRGHW